MRQSTLLAIIFGLVLIAAGGVIGYRVAIDKAHDWRVRAQVALADSTRIAEESEALRQQARVLALQNAELERVAARSVARGETWKRRADSGATELEAYRDSVIAANDSTVPVERLTDALVVIAAKDSVIATQNTVITAQLQQIANGGRMLAAMREDRDLWEGRAKELERVLIDLKPPTRPRVLGLLPVPSPTLAFVAGVAATLALK